MRKLLEEIFTDTDVGALLRRLDRARHPTPHT
jgi:hypothetical protein